MTERLLEKLVALDECTEMIVDARTQKCRMQNISVKKSLNIPLTFEFSTGFERPCSKASASKLKESFQMEHSSGDGEKKMHKLARDRKIRTSKLSNELMFKKCLFEKANVRPYSVPGNLKYQPTVEKLQPLEVSTRWKSVKPFLYPKSKDKAETEAVPLDKIDQPDVQSLKGLDLSTTFSAPCHQASHTEKERHIYIDFPGKRRSHSEKFAKLSDTSSISPKENVKPRKKHISKKDATCLERSKRLKNISAVERDLEKDKSQLIPLSIEDELTNPNAKIIHPGQPKQVKPVPVQSSTNPIVFHDTGHVQMFVLTKNRYHLKNEAPQLSEKTNLVLKKNNEIIKNLINDPSSDTFQPKRTFSDQWRVDTTPIPLGEETLLKEESQKKIDLSQSQVHMDDFMVQGVNLVDEKHSGLLTSRSSSQCLYSSNARHSKYLQNFQKIKNTARMTRLDDLLIRKPSKIVLMGKADTGLQDFRYKQSSNSFTYNDKFPSSVFESRFSMPGTTDQGIKLRTKEEQVFTSHNPLQFTSLQDAKNWLREKVAQAGSSSESDINFPSALPNTPASIN